MSPLTFNRKMPAVSIRLFVITLAILAGQVFGQNNSHTRLSIFYFGGSDCGYCNLPNNVTNIKNMRADFSRHHKGLSTKFVMVVMDEDIKEGLHYIEKYGYWDEISIGEFYNNELMLEHVNRSKIAGVPHIMVYRDSLSTDSLNVPIITKRILLKDLVGGSAIDKWIKENFSLEN